MTARLDITDNPGPCIALWGDSALGYAQFGPVRFESQDGRIWLVSDRPLSALSSGERHLWVCLQLLAAGVHLTESDITGCDALDATNVRALRTAAELMAEVAA
jgi:hypothetical protein